MVSACGHPLTTCYSTPHASHGALKKIVKKKKLSSASSFEIKYLETL